MPTLEKLRRLAAVLAGIVLLNQSLTFYNVWPTPKVTWRGDLSIELAVVLLGVLVAASRPRLLAALPRLAALIWVPLVAGRYLDVSAPALYGRPVNLYWDARHLAAVASMMTDAATGAMLVLVAVALLAGLAGVYLLARWAFAQVAAAAVRPSWRRALLAGCVVVLTVYGVERGGGAGLPGVAFAPPVSATYWHQGRLLAAQLTSSGPGLAAPVPTASDLSRVGGADVMLVFVESLGATTYDRRDLAAPLEDVRARFAEDVAQSGRQVVSAFVGSPTFGGSSWLAHVSLMSGVETRDEDTNATLMAQERDTLVTTFARAGYRTVALMPGLRHEWPEGAYYGFDHIYDTAALDYRGPRFGWWTVPDQFALARLDVLERAAASTAPRFVFFPTTSTHAPFGPTAPYQPDWTRLVTDDPYEAEAATRAQARVPDYLDLAPSYGRAVGYAYTTLGGYLARHADRNLVLVILGDHQPAAAVAGEGASWDVPMHVVASQPALLDRLRAEGFRDGMTPPRTALGPMHAMLPVLLEAFGDPAAGRAAR